jgi:hypothetical protein
MREEILRREKGICPQPPKPSGKSGQMGAVRGTVEILSVEANGELWIDDLGTIFTASGLPYAGVIIQVPKRL